MFSSRGVSRGAIEQALMIALTLGEVRGGLELDEAGERLYFSGKAAGLLAADCLRRRGMSALSGLNGLPVGIAQAVRAEAFSAALAARSWVIRQKSERRAHLLLLRSDRGRASWHGTSVALEAPALLWLPGSVDATVEVGPGAHGFLMSVDDDFLIKVVAGNAEALHLRRTTERVALIAGEALPPYIDTIAESCRAVVAELRTPGFGGATLISSHLLLLCLQLWRFSASHDERHEEAARGGGPAPGRQFPANGRAALSRRLAGGALCRRARRHLRQTARPRSAREELRPARDHPRAPGARSLH
jgi:hypothetical protein